MGLIDKLWETLPEFKRVGKKTELEDDKFKVHFYINKRPNEEPTIHLWANFKDDDGPGINFADKKVIQAYNTLVRELGYIDFILNADDYCHERSMMKGDEPIAMAATKFFIVSDIEIDEKSETDKRFEIAKKLLEFYKTHYDPSFENKF